MPSKSVDLGTGRTTIRYLNDATSTTVAKDWLNRRLHESKALGTQAHCTCIIGVLEQERVAAPDHDDINPLPSPKA